MIKVSNDINDRVIIKKGQRFMVLLFPLLGFGIKTFMPKSNLNIEQAREHLINEYKVLKMIEVFEMAPRAIHINEQGLFFEIVRGITLKELLKKIRSSMVDKDILNEVIEQILIYCVILDKMGIIKKEMHRPEKHVFIDFIRDKDTSKSKVKVKMIDFERAKIIGKEVSKNTNQFMQFLRRIEQIKIN